MRCIPNRKELQLLFRRSLKQSLEAVKVVSAFNRQTHRNRPLLSVRNSAYPLKFHGANSRNSWRRFYVRRTQPSRSRCADPIRHDVIKSVSVTRHRREASWCAYSHRMLPVFFLPNESPSAKTLFPYETHHRTVAFSIDHTGTNRPVPDRLPRCMASVSQSPAYLASDSSMNSQA
jgi:hypothetical protein